MKRTAQIAHGRASRLVDTSSIDAARTKPLQSGVPAKPSALVETRIIYCGDNFDIIKLDPKSQGE